MVVFVTPTAKMLKLFVQAAMSVGYKKNRDYNGDANVIIVVYRALNILQNMGEDIHRFVLILHHCLKVKKTIIIVILVFCQFHLWHLNSVLKRIEETFTMWIAIDKMVVLAPLQLLLLSGIGPREDFEAMDIGWVADIGGVGNNLRPFWCGHSSDCT